MNGLLKLSQAIDTFNAKVGRTATWAVLFAVIVCSVNALMRKLFDTSDFYKNYSNAMSEMQLFFFGVIFLLGAAYTLGLDEHVRIDVLSNRWSERKQMWMDAIGFGAFMVPICTLIFILSLSFVADSWASHETTGNSFLPLWPFKSLISLGYLTLIAQGVSEFIKRLAYFKGLIPFAQLRRHHSVEDEVAALADAIHVPKHTTAE